MTPAQKAQWEKNERDSKAREEANKKAIQSEKIKYLLKNWLLVNL